MGANVRVKQAVEIAMEYVRSLGDLFPAVDLRLEETILQDNGRWLITLSYHEPNTFDDRGYRMLEIDPVEKEVVAMRIREPQALDLGTF
jgi:hypothetical protein